MKPALLLFLACAPLAHGLTSVGDQTITTPVSLDEPAYLIGNLTLTSPGTYTAQSWNIVGNIRFAAPGNYELVATTGAINLTGQFISPNGRTTLHVRYRTALLFVGNTVLTDVSVIDDTKSVAPIETNPSSSSAPLVNLSTRATISTSAPLFAGFIVGGTTPRRVLVRAVGPGLVPFLVSGAASDPTLALYREGIQVAANDNWFSDDGPLNAAAASVGAFGLARGSRDAAVLVSLQPGAYSAVVKPASANDAGEVLVEVYFVD